MPVCLTKNYQWRLYWRTVHIYNGPLIDVYQEIVGQITFCDKLNTLDASANGFE